jgi:hypothetical protein
METTLLENLETFRNWDYDEEWEIFLSWMDEDADSWGDYDMMGAPQPQHWEHLYTFQLFVREARKDE